MAETFAEEMYSIPLLRMERKQIFAMYLSNDTNVKDLCVSAGNEYLFQSVLCSVRTVKKGGF